MPQRKWPVNGITHSSRPATLFLYSIDCALRDPPRATSPSWWYCDTEPLPSLYADVRQIDMPPSQPGDSPTHKNFFGVKSKRECEEHANAVAEAVAYEWRTEDSGDSPLCQVFTEDDVVQAVDEEGHECYVLAAGKTCAPHRMADRREGKGLEGA